MSKKIPFLSRSGLKIALVAFLLTALSTEVLARSGSSGRGRDSDQSGRDSRQSISRTSAGNMGSIEMRGRDRERNEIRQAVTQNDRDIIKDRIRLVAEPRATSSEINLRLEFPLEATTTNQIAQKTLDRMRLSREEIDRLLVVEQAEDEQINERIMVRADVKEDMTNVKADFRFAVASTTRAQIIDHIFSRLSALRLDDMLNVLDLRIMAELGCDIIPDNDDRRRPNRGRR